jgi:outer membrane protein OmpA-like peptidoglycan-associated protein
VNGETCRKSHFFSGNARNLLNYLKKLWIYGQINMLLFARFAFLLMLFPMFADAGMTSMRGPLFEHADAARDAAIASDAPLLAPVSYGEAMREYEKAESTFKRAGSIDWIRRYLGKAQERFDRARQAANLAAQALDTTIQARQDALSSEAPKYADDSWYSGEMSFAEATRRLERGSMKYAERYGKKAETAYRDAELQSIKANYLSETKELIKQAEKLRAAKYAPMSLNNARILLDTAESELTANRYDTDRPRLLALDAKHNALHAIYVAKLEKRVRDRSTNLEAILLEWEGSISRLGDELDLPVYFDQGEAQAVDALVAGIVELKQDKASLGQDLADREGQVAALTAQIDSMQTMMSEVNALEQEKALLDQDLGDRDAQVTLLNARLAKMQELLGGGNQTIDELETLLEQQARHRERFARVETLFESGQAEVFRQGDVVIIRMVGLNFDSGVAKLKSEHVALLDILQGAIAEFPESRVIVEGHTDAFGSDAQNQTLSQARAESVVSHLVETTAVSEMNVASVGYGESRPVANNETEQGRKRNRRIDVVIKPSWVTDEANTLASASVADDVLETEEI